MKYKLLSSAAALAALCLSCQHHPVYPEIGTLYITSMPVGAEVLLDGVTTRRMTPLKLDGVTAGGHELQIRYKGFKVWASAVTVQQGMTKRVVAILKPVSPQITDSCLGLPGDVRGLAYEPVSGRIYVTSGSARELFSYQYINGVVMPRSKIPIQTYSYDIIPGQKLVAVNPAANKIYVALWTDSLIVINFTTQTVSKRFQLPDTTINYVQMRFSDDGHKLFLADSNHSRIWLIDAMKDSVTGYLPLSGVPRDFLFDARRNRLYVAMASPTKVVAIDAVSGAELGSIPINGSRLSALVPDERWQRISGCAHDPNHPFVIDLDNFSLSDGPLIQDGNGNMVAAFFSRDQTNMWVVTSYEWHYHGDALDIQPGNMDLVYLPFQEYVSRYRLNLNPVAAVQSADGRYLIVAHGLWDMRRISNRFIIYKTDTE